MRTTAVAPSIQAVSAPSILTVSAKAEVALRKMVAAIADANRIGCRELDKFIPPPVIEIASLLKGHRYRFRRFLCAPHDRAALRKFCRPRFRRSGPRRR